MIGASAKVAAVILERLVADGLVVAGDRDRLAASLAAGGLKATDWTLAVQKPLDLDEKQ